MIIKTQEELEKLKKGGKVLAFILQKTKEYSLDNYKKGNLTTKDIDNFINSLLDKKKIQSSFKNYQSSKNKAPFSGNACISINEEIVHGVPSDRKLKENDIVSIDLGVIYENLYTDASISFILGGGFEEDRKLVKTAKESLMAGIKEAKVGNKTGDIGNAIERKVLESGFNVVKNYCGHGVGHSVHEDPSIPNHGPRGSGEEIKEGMVLAIEPMVVTGSGKVKIGENGWVVETVDGKRAAHFEHTVVVGEKGPIIITKFEN